MSSTPRISVVIPAFNRAPVLPRAIDSVLRQTLPPDEVIVVDDASEDDTAGVAQAYGTVRYVRLPTRSGAQAARNRGIREAQGDWIAFQDSDDEWLPDKLERQVALLAGRDFDPWTVVHGQGIVDPVGGEPWRIPRQPLDDDALDDLLQRPATLFPALVVSRKALSRIGGLDEEALSYHEWETSIRLARFSRFVAPEEPLFVYHLGAGDAISASKLDDLRGYQYVIEKFRDQIVERGGPGAWNAHVAHQVRRSLEFELWEEADQLLLLVQPRRVRYHAYALCRRLKLKPSYVGRLRRLSQLRA